MEVIPDGSRIVLIAETYPYFTPGGTPRSGIQPLGSGGTKRGSSQVNGAWWYWVDFDTGMDGWITAHAAVESTPAPTPEPTTSMELIPDGSRIVVITETYPYSTPGGTPRSRIQPLGSGGTKRGSSQVNGTWWYWVDFDTGMDGWIPAHAVVL
jgi:hypothetical protein